VILLRDYQNAAIADVDRQIEAGKRCVMVVAPTGAGKAVILAAVTRRAAAEGKRVLVLAHTREIIKQTARKIYDNGVQNFGIIAAGLQEHPGEPVQVASIQTLWSRAFQRDRMPLPAAHVLIVDESHHCPAETYRKIIASYPNAVLLGFTATPCRGDGRGLGGIFEAIVQTPQIAKLIEQGYLVKTRVYAPIDPDLSGVRTVAGDYVEKQLAERMDRDNLVGDIVTHWHRYGERRKTVCFAVNVAHSLHIRDEFRTAGVVAEHVDGGTPKPDRDAALARLASGETEIITNCMVLTEGWDMPAASCAILARPTRKMGLYRQMVGRILRPAPDKADAVVLDHSGAVFRHGFVEDRVDWTLDPEKRAYSPIHAARLHSGYSSRLLECTQCGAIRVAGEACRHCGFLPQRRPDAIVFGNGELALVDRRRRVAATAFDAAERARWHGMLTFVAQARGYKQKWIHYTYLEKFGVEPPAHPVKPIPPKPEVWSYVRSRMIAYAKAQLKLKARAS
jgi:DNA repair protein RadD